MTDELVKTWFKFDKGQGNALNQLDRPCGIAFDGESILISYSGMSYYIDPTLGALLYRSHLETDFNVPMFNNEKA